MKIILSVAIILIISIKHANANCNVTYSSDTSISNTIECADNQTMTVNEGVTLSQASGASGMINIVGEENFTLVNNGTIDPGQSNAWQAINLKDATSFDITNNGTINGPGQMIEFIGNKKIKDKKSNREKNPGFKGFAQRALPWGSTGYTEVESDKMNEGEMEVEQLYGLHNKQGAELSSHQKDIDFLNTKIDSIGSDVSMIMNMLKTLKEDLNGGSNSPDTTSVDVVGEMAQMQMKVKLNKDRVDKYTMFFDSVRFDMNQK